MALNLGAQQFIGQRAKTLIAKQNILKLGEGSLKIINADGPPFGQYEIGNLFFNSFDRKLYISDNFFAANRPTGFYYKLNGNGQDFSTGQRNDLTTAGDPVYTSGRNGQGIILDGTDDKLIIPKAVNWDLTSNWCFGILVKLPAGFANGEEVYLLEAYENAGSYFTVSIVGNGATAYVRVRSESTFPDDETGTDTIPLNTWTLIWIRHGEAPGEGITVYINTDTEYFGTYRVNATTKDFEIGRSQVDSSFGDNSFLVDDVRLWKNTSRAPISLLDWVDLDKNHWTTYTGTMVEAI